MRTCALSTCRSRVEAKRLCSRHYRQWLDTGRLPVVTQTPTEARLEDALFLLDVGEHPERIARRVGVSIRALERAFRDHRRGTEITRISAQLRKERRL